VDAVQLNSALLLGWQVWVFALEVITQAQMPSLSKMQMLEDHDQYRKPYLTDWRQMSLQYLDLLFLLSGPSIA
jgi:hypothetical protein